MQALYSFRKNDFLLSKSENFRVIKNKYALRTTQPLTLFTATGVADQHP